MSEQSTPQLPQYQPPTPTHQQAEFAERKQSSILWKAIKQLTKARVQTKTPRTRQRNWKKRLPYY